MVDFILFATGCLVYGLGAGITFAVTFHIHKEVYEVEMLGFVTALAWPVALPALIACYFVKRVLEADFSKPSTDDEINGLREDIDGM